MFGPEANHLGLFWRQTGQTSAPDELVGVDSCLQCVAIRWLCSVHARDFDHVPYIQRGSFVLLDAECLLAGHEGRRI